MNIHELHDRLFEVLCTVDDICREEGVRYFLDSGTAIGAMREKDFIPWDDDMDIKVLSEDYPAFKAAMERRLPAHMHFVEPDAFAPHFYDFVARIVDDRYFLREPTEEDAFYGNLQNRVGTDVFVLSPAPSSPLLQGLTALRLKVLYGMGMAHRYAIRDARYTPLQRAQVAVLRAAGRLVPAKRVVAWWRDMAFGARAKSIGGGYRFTVNYPLAWLRFFPAEWFETASQGEIRGRHFPVAGNVDAELTSIYGDYRTPHRDPDLYVQHLDEKDMA